MIPAALFLSFVIASSRWSVPPHRIDDVVALVEAIVLQRLVEEERESRVRRIDDDSLAAQFGQRIDFGLDDNLVEAMIAAGDDDRIRFGNLHHRDRIVGRSLDDLVIAPGEPLALRARIRSV
jgi:hypothetical protein